MHRSLIANFLGRKATLFIAVLSLVGVASTADARPKKPRKPVATAKTPAAKAAPVITAENKAALLALMGDYKFAMTQAEVTVVVKQQIDARYVEKFEETTDVMKQDRLRKDKKEELKRFTDSSIEFDDKKGGWDVSLIEHEFGHNSGESMMVNWENDNGKNQRRFFFFHESHLYKMFISLDVSKLPDDKKDFGTFEATMEGNFGRGAADAGKIGGSPAAGGTRAPAR